MNIELNKQENEQQNVINQEKKKENNNTLIELSPEQIVEKLFADNLNKKLQLLNEARLKAKPKSNKEDAQLILASDLTREEMAHCLASLGNRLAEVKFNLYTIMQSIH